MKEYLYGFIRRFVMLSFILAVICLSFFAVGCFIAWEIPSWETIEKYGAHPIIYRIVFFAIAVISILDPSDDIHIR